MTTYCTDDPIPSRSRLWNAAALAWRIVARSSERRAARATLHKLDDYLLKDMGVSRSEIDSTVYGRMHRRGGGSCSDAQAQ